MVLFLFDMKHQKQILNIALPAMGENLLQMLMGLVDNYLVAQLGLSAVSGVAVANNIITIYQALFIAIGSAITSVVAKSLAQKDQSAYQGYQNDALSLTIILSLILGVISVVWGTTLLKLLGTQNSVSEIGGRYLALVGGGVLFLGLMTSLGSLLRARGRVRLPMYVSLVSNLLNALLSTLAIFLFNWGVEGVAAATVLSRAIGTLILAKQLKLKVWDWQFHLAIDRDLLRLALPASLERLMMRAGDLVIVALIVTFGTKVVAGNAIGETLTQFNYMPGLGLSTAAVVLTAHYLGQAKIDQIRQVERAIYLIAVLSMGVLAGFILLLGPVLGRLFTDNTSALQASQTVLLFSFLGTPVTAGTLVYTAIWQGLGNAKLPFYTTSIGMWLIRVLIGYLLGISLQLGLSGVWMATVLDNLFRHFFLYKRYRRYIG